MLPPMAALAVALLSVTSWMFGPLGPDVDFTGLLHRANTDCLTPMLDHLSLNRTSWIIIDNRSAKHSPKEIHVTYAPTKTITLPHRLTPHPRVDLTLPNRAGLLDLSGHCAKSAIPSATGTGEVKGRFSQPVLPPDHSADDTHTRNLKSTLFFAIGTFGALCVVLVVILGYVARPFRTKLRSTQDSEGIDGVDLWEPADLRLSLSDIKAIFHALFWPFRALDKLAHLRCSTANETLVKQVVLLEADLVNLRKTISDQKAMIEDLDRKNQALTTSLISSRAPRTTPASSATATPPPNAPTGPSKPSTPQTTPVSSTTATPPPNAPTGPSKPFTPQIRPASSSTAGPPPNAPKGPSKPSIPRSGYSATKAQAFRPSSHTPHPNAAVFAPQTRTTGYSQSNFQAPPPVNPAYPNLHHQRPQGGPGQFSFRALHQQQFPAIVPAPQPATPTPFSQHDSQQPQTGTSQCPQYSMRPQTSNFEPQYQPNGPPQQLLQGPMPRPPPARPQQPVQGFSQQMPHGTPQQPPQGFVWPPPQSKPRQSPQGTLQQPSQGTTQQPPQGAAQTPPHRADQQPPRPANGTQGPPSGLSASKYAH